MLPISDMNPTRRFPILTWAIIGLNVVVFIWEMTLSAPALESAFMDLAVVPANITHAPFALESSLDAIRSMFMHGGFEHIIGNMLYLYLFGDNLEDRMGGLLYIGLYLVSGFAAIIAQVLISPGSTVPMVGASGAIAGVLGGYMIMFPNVRVRGIIPLGRIGTIQEMPAIFVLGFWFVLQLFNGLTSLGVPTASGGGTAFFAHIGGFVVGLMLTWLFMRMVPQPPSGDRNRVLYQRTRRYPF